MEKPFFFILFMTFVCIMISVVDSCAFTNKYSIMVINDNVKEKVQVHCKSKDTDIGLKSISLHESVAWSFCENIQASTLFYCNFRLGKKHQVFNVYDRKVKPFCGHAPKGDGIPRVCKWYIRSDGFYQIGMDGLQETKYYDWKVDQARYKGSKLRDLP